MYDHQRMQEMHSVDKPQLLTALGETYNERGERISIRWKNGWGWWWEESGGRCVSGSLPYSRGLIYNTVSPLNMNTHPHPPFSDPDLHSIEFGSICCCLANDLIQSLIAENIGDAMRWWWWWLWVVMQLTNTQALTLHYYLILSIFALHLIWFYCG